MIITSHKLSDDVLAVLLFPFMILAITARLPRSFRERITRRVLGATLEEWGQIPAAAKASIRRNDWVTATMFICFSTVLAWLAMFLVSGNTGILVAAVGGCLVAAGIHIRRRRRVLRVLGRASLLVLMPAMAAILSTTHPASGSVVGSRSLGETAEEVEYAPDSTYMVVGSFGEMLATVCDVGLATNQECQRVKRFRACLTPAPTIWRHATTGKERQRPDGRPTIWVPRRMLFGSLSVASHATRCLWGGVSRPSGNG